MLKLEANKHLQEWREGVGGRRKLKSFLTIMK